MKGSEASVLALLRPGMRVAVADGVGCPIAALGPLSAAAAQVGDIELLLGWAPAPLDGLETSAFGMVRTVMGGYALRAAVDAGAVRYVPTRLGAVPSLLAGPLRCDLLVASVVPGRDGHRLGTEVGWARAAIAGGAHVLAVERPGLPALDGGPPLRPDQLTVIDRSDAPASEISWAEPGEDAREIGRLVATLIGEGSRIQYGPGPVGAAVLDAIEVPVRIDTGMLTDPIVALADRGLLLGRSFGPYTAGSAALYAWCDGRVDLAGVEVTHDPARLGGHPPLVAVNTALEIDLDGQVNVESVVGSSIAGVGGQPDYAGAAARSVEGLSVLALPTHRGHHATLVERLSAPVSTASHDVEVIVTERGVADLRGLDRAERRIAIASLW